MAMKDIDILPSANACYSMLLQSSKPLKQKVETGSPLDFSSVVADTHVPEHDAAISSCGGKEVALTPCSLGCLSLHHKHISLPKLQL